MKNVLLSTVFALFLLPAATFAADQTTAPQQTKAQSKAAKKPITQKQIDAQECDKTAQSDKAVDDLYQSLIKYYSSYDPVLTKYLKQSQDAWLAYRDARMNAIYPPEYHDSMGSAIASCHCKTKTEMDEDRLDELRQWSADGDFTGKTACAGTRR